MSDLASHVPLGADLPDDASNPPVLQGIAPPRIHSIDPTPQRLGWDGRLVAAVVATCCLVVLAIAAILKPNPSGLGSHTPLGLSSCTMVSRSNIPCPSCGMTTSFTWFVRGNILASLYVQPMGMLLALATSVTLWASLYIAITGRPLHRLLRPIPSRYYVLLPMVLVLLAWFWKIFIHLRGIDGWG